MASTAALSAAFFSPLPIQRAAASAPYSVTRTSSIATLRSGTADSCSPVIRSNSCAGVFASIGLGLDRARRLAGALALGLADDPAGADPRRADQAHPVADL